MSQGPSDWRNGLAAADRLYRAGDMTGALAALDEILAAPYPDQVVPLNGGALLIDIGNALKRLDLVDRGTSLLESIRGSVGEESSRVSLEYDLANGYSYRGQLTLRQQGAWTAWGIQENEDTQLAKTTLSELLLAEGGRGKPEAWVNLGATLSHLGRPIDALDAYDAALRLDPTHPGALGTRGKELLWLTPHLGPMARATAIEAGRHLARALASERLGDILGPGIRAHWTKSLEEIERKTGTKISTNDAPIHPPADLSRLSAPVREYVEFCRDRHLFLTWHLLDEGAEHALGDHMFIRTIESPAPASRFEALAPIVNQIKEDYATARYLLFLSSRQTKERDEINELTELVMLEERSYFNLYGGLGKAAFGHAFDVLDKIAFLLNQYLGIGLKSDRVHFSNFWRHLEDSKLPAAKIRVTPVIRAIPSRLLVGIVDLARDLDREQFRRVRRIRNALTHRCLVLTDGHTETREVDGVLYVPWRAMRRESLRTLRLARSAIFSLIAFISEWEQKQAGDRCHHTVNIQVPSGQTIPPPPDPL
jgi:tetratricopeptide (TPR) repeat protein